MEKCATRIKNEFTQWRLLVEEPNKLSEPVGVEQSVFQSYWPIEIPRVWQ